MGPLDGTQLEGRARSPLRAAYTADMGSRGAHGVTRLTADLWPVAVTPE